MDARSKGPAGRAGSGLHVAVSSIDGLLPAWVELALSRAQASGFVTSVTCILSQHDTAATLSGERAPPAPFSHRLFRAWASGDRRYFTPAVSPWARRRWSAATGSIPGRTDVLLQLDGGVLPDELLQAVPVLGIWEVAVGATTGCAFEPGRAGIAELLDGRPTSEIRLVECSDDHPAARVLGCTSTETSLVSPTVTLARLAWLATELLDRALQRAARGEQRHVNDKAPVERADARWSAGLEVHGVAGQVAREHPAGVVGFLFARLYAWGRRAAVERAYEERWHVRYALAPEPVLNVAAFEKVPVPRDRYWADPHVIRRDGRFHVFIEEYVYALRRGRIVTFTIDDDGRIGAPQLALDEPHHLSYPFVFEHAGDVWMVPETGAVDAIQLYRSTVFPHRWERVRSLIPDTYAVDATLYRAPDDRWWMFASLARNPGRHPHDEVSLFSTDDPVTGDWVPHRDAVAVCDPHRARPAGALFRMAGRLYRPAQDGVGEYGYAVRLMQVDSLTDGLYAEHETRALLPERALGWRGIHTCTHTPGITLIDVKTRECRFSIARLLRRFRAAFGERRTPPGGRQESAAIQRLR